MISSKALRKISPRSRGFFAAQAGNGALAASNAAFASSTVALATEATLFSVAGSMTSKRPPSEDLRHLPPIQRSVGTLARRLSYRAVIVERSLEIVFAVLQLDQDVLIEAAREVAQLVFLTGVVPDHAADLVVRNDGVTIDILELDPAAGDVDNHVIHGVMVPGLLAAGRHLHVPNAYLVVLKNNFGSDRAAWIFARRFGCRRALFEVLFCHGPSPSGIEAALHAFGDAIDAR